LVQKMQEQQQLHEAMKEQEKLLKNHLASLNRKQMDEYNEKLKLARLSDQQHGQEMAQVALAEEKRRRDIEK
jgi:hypothetical protein